MIKNWRPILYKPPMVRGILGGIKDVTRRLIDPQPEFIPGQGWEWMPRRRKDQALFQGNDLELRQYLSDPAMGFSPYGYGHQDGLWVRETWQWREGFSGAGVYIFAADHEAKEPMTWRPSIHMPKEACRLFQQVVSVRPERLREITDQDALREGIERGQLTVGWDSEVYKDYLADASGYGDPRVDWPCTDTPLNSYRSLWDWINGKGSFDSDPWVWRIEAKVIERPENF